MAKKSATRGKLHPASFQKFVQEIYQDPKLKANVIAELQSLGFRAFANKHFDLITRQKKELDTIKDADVDAVFTNAIIAALHRNGPLELVHESHNPPNLRVEFYARWGDGGPEVGVRVSC